MKSQLFKLSQAVDFGEEKGFAIQFSSINHCPFPRAAADSSHVHSVLQKQNNHDSPPSPSPTQHRLRNQNERAITLSYSNSLETKAENQLN